MSKQEDTVDAVISTKENDDVALFCPLSSVVTVIQQVRRDSSPPPPPPPLDSLPKIQTTALPAASRKPIPPPAPPPLFVGSAPQGKFKLKPVDAAAHTQREEDKVVAC